MIKKIYLATLLSVVCSQAFSQQKFQSELNVLIGPSIPMGNFSHPEDLQNNLGPAKTGELLKLSFAHHLKNNLALLAQIHFQRNPLNTAMLQNELANGGFYSGTYLLGSYPPTFPPPPPQPPSPSPYKKWNVKNSSWYIASLMVGGLLKTPIRTDKKFTAFAGFQLGAAYVTTPKIQASASTDTSQIAVQQNSRSEFAFAYSINAGLNYRLSSSIRLALHCDYFGTSQVNYHQLKTNAGGASGEGLGGSRWSSQISRNVKQNISCINIGIGASFSL